jgi:hypothetical protein
MGVGCSMAAHRLVHDAPSSGGRAQQRSRERARGGRAAHCWGGHGRTRAHRAGLEGFLPTTATGPEFGARRAGKDGLLGWAGWVGVGGRWARAIEGQGDAPAQRAGGKSCAPGSAARRTAAGRPWARGPVPRARLPHEISAAGDLARRSSLQQGFGVNAARGRGMVSLYGRQLQRWDLHGWGRRRAWEPSSEMRISGAGC